MPYLSSINPSTGDDRYEGVEVLNVFADMRLEFELRGLLRYQDGDPLFEAINRVEAITRTRLEEVGNV